MTAYYDFVPNANTPFQFQPTLDGDTYNIIVAWNLFGQRWYINVYDLPGNLIVATPLIGSPPTYTVQNASWTEGYATLAFTARHGYPVGTTLAMTISGMVPDVYNGTYLVFATSPSAVAYEIASDPGQAKQFGSAGTDINLVAGYFSSTIVFRQSDQRFEISP